MALAMESVKCTPPDRGRSARYNGTLSRRSSAMLPVATSTPADRARKQQYESGKLAKRLRRQVGQAIADFQMIQDGDRVMVCLSGGKDSYTLLDMLLQLQARAPVRFELVAVNLDQKQPGFPAHVLPQYLGERGVPFHIIEQDTYSTVTRVIPEGRTMCSLCSRLRRGALYQWAADNGISKIALGHHRDDILGTFFLNLFYQAQLKAMPPKLRSDDGRHVVIRPLAYCHESDIAAYAAERAFPIIPCNLCGSQENLQRKAVARMLAEWEQQQPGRSENIFRALGSVSPSQLADRKLFDFAALDAREDVHRADAHGWLAGYPSTDVSSSDV
jgi:tRNA 2-thiocytidine biosynthesis protein TtcA